MTTIETTPISDAIQRQRVTNNRLIFYGGGGRGGEHETERLIRSEPYHDLD